MLKNCKNKIFSFQQKDYYISFANSSKGHEKYNIDFDLVKNGLKPLRKDLVLKHEPMKQNRRFEERIESAKKLVKKLQKFCSHYEVSTKGEKAGRVYCKVCERHLGAVSSTLKNHINTQDHRQALERNTDSVRNEKNKTNELNRISYSNNNYNSINPRNSSNLRDFNALNNNGSEFDIEIAWVPGFQSPNSCDFSTF
jgi:exonuclease VII small subunit